jgi:uncharacterized repeat protein (TIGR03803 family)
MKFPPPRRLLQRCTKALLFFSALVLGLLGSARLTAQTLRTLYNSSDEPSGALTLSGKTLYGTTANGIVFALNSDGTGFTSLHSFSDSEDTLPMAGLVVSNNMLYGTTWNGPGTVFAVNTDGTGFTNLHSFSGSDGFNPQATLVLLSDSLYGTTVSGGPQGLSMLSVGTVFALNTDGTSFTMLHFFDRIGQLLTPPYPYVNFDGFGPTYLISSGKTLYGTALRGGGDGLNTVFQLNTDGAGFQVLHDFTMCCPYPPVPWTTNSDGGSPNGLSLLGNTLYGTANNMGVWGNGTVFSVSVPVPQLAIIRSGMNVVLSWPTHYVGYTLQSSMDLVSPVWTTNLPAPVVVGGQYAVTNPISGTPHFFRLSQ